MWTTLGGLTIAGVVLVAALAGCTGSMRGDAMMGGDTMKKSDGTMMEKK
jgi:hypothetical protein